MNTYLQRFKDLDERFWEKVQREDEIFPENGCILWTGAKQRDGYGVFWVNQRQRPAHRWGYERYRGPVPDGMELDHLCRVRHCVNPDHLEVVTCKVNINRGDTSEHQRRKTHCPQGHEYTPENTIRERPTWRRCRTCHYERNKRYAR